MQRSSPFGYRRSACRPRKRGLIGVFSSGNCTVTLRLKRCRPVSAIPFSSSTSSQVLKNSRTRRATFMSVGNVRPDPPTPLGGQRAQRAWGNVSSVEETRVARLHHRAKEDDPHERNRDEHLPAQPHDL